MEQPFPNVKMWFNLQVKQAIISMDGHQLRKGGYVFYLYQDSLEVQPTKQSMDDSGQNIATSHDLTPNGGLVREIPLFQGNLGW